MIAEKAADLIRNIDSVKYLRERTDKLQFCGDDDDDDDDYDDD